MGRKSIYNPDTLEIGESLRLKRTVSKFADQYAHNWRKRYDRNFKVVKEGNDILIKRVE